MQIIELYKKGRGFLPASEETAEFHARQEDGEALLFEQIDARDPVEFRRYWQLCTFCAQHCERVVLPVGGVISVPRKNGKNAIHLALKILTGHFDTICDEAGKPVLLAVKSTSFKAMKASEWAEYWPRVRGAVEEVILPGVPWSEVQTEILKLMGWAR